MLVNKLNWILDGDDMAWVNGIAVVDHSGECGGFTGPCGADDQDQDGMSNLQELDRHYALTPGGQNLWVNPYNPCLPDFLSRTCTLHPPMSDPWAPFPIPPGTTSPLTTTKLGAGPTFIPHA